MDLAHGTVSSYSSRSKESCSGSSENRRDSISQSSLTFAPRTAAQMSQYPMSLVSRISISYPASSRNSRVAAWAEVSPSSTCPPGISQPLRRLCQTIRKRSPEKATA